MERLAADMSEMFAMVAETMRESDSEKARADYETFLKSQKFIFDVIDIPEKLLTGARDFGEQLQKFGLFRLPFQSTSFVFTPCLAQISEPERAEGKPSASVLLCWTESGRIYWRHYAVIKEQLPHAWTVFPAACSSSFKEQDATNREEFSLEIDGIGAIKIDADDLKAASDLTGLAFHADDEGLLASASRGTGKSDDGAVYISLDHILLTASVGILASDGIITVERKEPKFINKQRIKKGRHPLFGFKNVMIDLSAIKMPGVKGDGQSHASPRLHWRRGHIRRLTSGNLVTVRPCLVGKIDNGVIEHNYIGRA